jgi:hypothetical protein
MIRIKEFYLEESKVNKGLMILVAYDANGQKWVCSGNHYSPTYAVKYEDAFDTKEIISDRKSKSNAATFPMNLRILY